MNKYIHYAIVSTFYILGIVTAVFAVVGMQTFTLYLAEQSVECEKVPTNDVCNDLPMLWQFVDAAPYIVIAFVVLLFYTKMVALWPLLKKKQTA